MTIYIVYISIEVGIVENFEVGFCNGVFVIEQKCRAVIADGTFVCISDNVDVFYRCHAFKVDQKRRSGLTV